MLASDAVSWFLMESGDFTRFSLELFSVDFKYFRFDPSKIHTGKVPGSTGLIGLVCSANFGSFLCCV